MLDSEISIDCFAGGGGASTGMTAALGRSPAIAINHWGSALQVHAENHPETLHITEDIWAVDPVAAVAGRRVGVAWFSPDCTHHSKAKGGKPRSNKLRGLPWSVVRWAAAVRPRVLLMENVEEIEQWGPLDAEGNPIRARRGQTFRAFVRRLEKLGYRVEWRILRACDYGAPTTRKRLYLIARLDGIAPQWPEPTHGPGRALPWRTAAEIVDWSLPCPSIFDRARPLADKTMARIARGVRVFVLEAARPFIIKAKTHGGGGNEPMSADEPLRTVTASKRGEFALVAPYLVHVSNGERVGQEPRIYDVQRPLGTVVAQGQKHALCAAFLARHYSDRPGGGWAGGASLDRPLPTVTTKDHHSLVAAFLTKFYGTSTGASLDSPAPTVCAGAEHLGLVTVRIDGELYSIADIGMRMLTPAELFAAQGFPSTYQFATGADGVPLTKTAQVRLAGNSVCPPVAEALVRANTGAHLHLHSRGAHGRQESLWI